MAAGQGFKTFATGDVLTAADTNGYLMQGVWTFASAAARDAAVTSPQEGNMCYLKDTDAVQYYSGSAWTAVGGGGAASFVGVNCTKITTNQTIPSSTYTVVTFNSEDFDTSSFHDNSTNNSRLTVPSGKAGYYYAYFAITYTGNATNGSFGRRAFIQKNGTVASLVNDWSDVSAAISKTLSGGKTFSLSVGDYLEVNTFQSSGGNLDLQAGDYLCNFGMIYLGA